MQSSAIIYLLDTNALVYPAESLEDEETGVLDEVIDTSNQEEIIHQHLQGG